MGFNVQFNVPAFGGKFQGIGQQVEKHFFHLYLIENQGDVVSIGHKAHSDAFASGSAFNGRKNFAQEND